MLDREQIIQEAYERCMEEMYLKAQPSVDFKQLIKDIKDGKIEDSKENPVYDRYYLSFDEYNHIKEKYMKAYRLNEEWSSNIDVLEDYLNNGGTKDKYIKSYTDEDGRYHPGYRGYENVAPIKEQILNILNIHLGNGNYSGVLCDEIVSTIMNTVKNCKDFYRFDREHSTFSVSLSLGAVPTSNKKTVEEYWQSHGMPDFKIKERNPLLLWEYDYYGDEFEEVMKDEYGVNWEQEWDDKWKAEIEKKEAEKAEWQRRYDEMLKTNNN